MILDTSSEVTNYVTGKITGTMEEFYQFLLDNKIIQLSTAFIIGTQANRLGSDFVDNIISPIINRVVGGQQDTLNNLRLEIFGIRFEIGNFLASFMKFIIFMFVLFYIFKIIGYKK